MVSPRVEYIGILQRYGLASPEAHSFLEKHSRDAAFTRYAIILETLAKNRAKFVLGAAQLLNQFFG